MRVPVLIILVALLPVALSAQAFAPAGTILPVRLDTGLNARKLRTDQPIRARIMQNIPGTSIHRGAQLLGHVVQVSPTSISLTFDTLAANGRRTRVTTNLRALASMLEVEEAQIPLAMSSPGLNPETWNTQQIGGDTVYRAGGSVAHGMTVVGEPTAYGVRGPLIAHRPCRAAVDDNDQPQAFWLFSTSACGLYGFDCLTLEHAGRTHPSGVIQIAARSGGLNIRSGAGMLLRVEGR